MATIGKLNYQITSNTSGFTAGVVATRQELAMTRRVMRDTMTPAEELGESIDGLRQLFHKELITLEQYNRAVKKLEDSTPAAIAQQEAFAAAVAKGKSITEGVITPTEAYARTADELKESLDGGHITQETYTRALEQARQKLPEVKKAQDELTAAVARGKAITEGVATPTERYAQKHAELDALLKDGHISQEAHTRALRAAQSEMRAAEMAAERYGRALTTIGSRMSLMVTAPILAMGGASLKAAVDAAEGQSKFETVFRDVGISAKGMVEDLRESYGLAREQATRLLTDTADLLTGFQFDQGFALELSGEVQRLAVDLASFTNVEGGAERASQALTAGLLGQREQMKALGIVVNENSQEWKEMLAHIEETTGLTGTQAKALTTLRMAQQQSTNAIGDYARTSDSVANRSRQLVAITKDLGVEFGSVLIPVAQDLLNAVFPLVKGVADLSDGWKTTIVVSAGVAAAAGPVILMTGQMVTAVRSLTVAYRTMQAAQLASAASVGGFAVAAAGAVYVGWQLGKSIDGLSASSQTASRVIGELKDQASGFGSVEFSGVDSEATERIIGQTEARIQKTRDHIEELKSAQAWWNLGLANQDLIEAEEAAIEGMSQALEKARGHMQGLHADAQQASGELGPSEDTIKKFDDYVESLKFAQATLGMTAHQVVLYKLELEGADDVMLGLADATYQEMDAARQQHEAAEQAKRDAEDLAIRIDDLSSTWTEQALTMGMATEELELYRLAQAGATEEQLASARAARQSLDEMRGWHTAMEEGRQLTERYKDPIAKVGEELDRLQELFNDGHISQDVFRKAIQDTREQLAPPITTTFETRGLDSAVEGSMAFAEAIAAQRDAANVANSDAVITSVAQAAVDQGITISDAMAARKDPAAEAQDASRAVLERIATIMERVADAAERTADADPLDVEEVTIT